MKELQEVSSPTSRSEQGQPGGQDRKMLMVLSGLQKLQG